MGLLDDAIREHLELKRRRGADPSEIDRQESEALGPVDRGPDGAPDLADTFTPPEPAAEPPAPGGSERLTLQAGDLPGVGAVGALELEVLSDGVVEQSHAPEATRRG